MNRFGRLAREAWQTLAPTSYAQIVDPKAHFSTLGEQAEAEWAILWPQLVEPDAEGEDFFHKAGRIEAAKTQAEEIIRQEWLTPPADEWDPEEGEEPGPLSDVAQAWQDLMDSPEA